MSLQQGTITLAQDIPERVIIGEKNYTSTSDSSLNRRHVEIPPMNETTYTPSGSNEIIFQISSSTSFIDWQNSYVRGTLTLSQSVASRQFFARLGRSGIHSIFSSAELRHVSTGTVVEHIDPYHTLVTQEDLQIYSDREMDLFAEELKCGENDLKLKGFAIFAPASTGAVNSDTAETLVATWTMAGATLRDSRLIIQPGDFVQMIVGTGGKTNVASAANRMVQVRSISAQGVIVLEETQSVITFLPVTFAVYGLPRSLKIGYLQAAAVASNSIEFAFKPRLGIFRHKQYDPLFLSSRGYELILRIDPNIYRAFVLDPIAGGGSMEVNHFVGIIPAVTTETTAAVAASNTFTLQVSNTRYCAVLYDFHSAINQDIVDLYANQRGLLLPFKAWHVHQKIIDGTASTQVIDMQMGRRSVNRVFSRMIINSYWSTNYRRQSLTPRLETCHPLGLQRFQYNSGSTDYPQRSIDVSLGSLPISTTATAQAKPMASNALRHQKIASKKYRDKDSTGYLYQEEPWNASSVPGNTIALRPMKDYHVPDYFVPFDVAGGYSHVLYGNDSVIMSAVLSRDPHGFFAGLDLSLNPLRLTLEFDKTLTEVFTAQGDTILAAGALTSDQRLVQTFVEYDCYRFLRQENGLTILS